MSHSHFLGGPPAWTESDREKALVYEEWLQEPCKDCGTRPDDWDDDPTAMVGYTWRCPGCEAIALERDNVDKDAKGVHVGLIPRALAQQLAEEEAREEIAKRKKQQEDAEDQ